MEERLDERAAKLGSFLRNGLDDIASRYERLRAPITQRCLESGLHMSSKVPTKA